MYFYSHCTDLLKYWVFYLLFFKKAYRKTEKRWVLNILASSKQRKCYGYGVFFKKTVFLFPQYLLKKKNPFYTNYLHYTESLTRVMEILLIHLNSMQFWVSCSLLFLSTKFIILNNSVFFKLCILLFQTYC